MAIPHCYPTRSHGSWISQRYKNLVGVQTTSYLVTYAANSKRLSILGLKNAVVCTRNMKSHIHREKSSSVVLHTTTGLTTIRYEPLIRTPDQVHRISKKPVFK